MELVNNAKKQEIKREYVVNMGIDCPEVLTQHLLDQNIFSATEYRELVEVCKFCLPNYDRGHLGTEVERAIYEFECFNLNNN